MMEVPILGCPICYQILDEPRFLICGHGFCEECIESALTYKSECPICREFIHEEDDEMCPTCTRNHPLKRIFVVEDAVVDIRGFIMEKNQELFDLKRRMEELEKENDELKLSKTNLEAQVGSSEKRLRESDKSLRKKRMRIKMMKKSIKNSIDCLQHIDSDEEDGGDDNAKPYPVCSGIRRSSDNEN